MELPRTPLLLKICALAVAAFTAFLLGRQSASRLHLIFFADAPTPSVAISNNAALKFDLSSLIPNQTLALNPPPPLPPPPPPPPSPPPPPFRFGIVDENGKMAEDFEVGSDLGSDLGFENETETVESKGSEESKERGWVRKYKYCDMRMVEYMPCMDNQEALRKLKSTERGERFERHCPERGLDCLVPVPKGYRVPILWPRSRDEVWVNNVPHVHLVDDKGGQNWISRDKDKFKFPGGGTQFIHGANQYLNKISEMVPNIAFGQNTRVALDIGCGVASFGAFLLSRNVITMSIARKDVHENQIQFALERNVPAMIAAFATRRLPYPSQAFDLIHCSECRINWTRDDGILLLEVNRMLRGGGYFVWAAQPVYKHEDKQQQAWRDMEDLTKRICWDLMKKDRYIAIWRKPSNNTCYINRGVESQPPLCDVEDDSNDAWYATLKACISRLPDNGYETVIRTWPARVHEPPKRLQSVVMDSFDSQAVLFKAESKYWNDIVGSYVRAFRWKKMNLRNVMDMRAGFGGFAAALIDHNIDGWVMNVVPVSEPNTLPVIYDRGLIGVNHDWCEPFDTYPRTYDFLHASGLFSTERKRCNISIILLEMDRILRPGGRAYIEDTKSIIDGVQEITKAMGWRTELRDTAEGYNASRKMLMCQKEKPR